MIIEITSINEFCRMFRKNILNFTLKEMESKTGVKVPTLSSFEHGRSKNMEHIKLYYNLGNKEQREYFKKNIPLYRGL